MYVTFGFGSGDIVGRSGRAEGRGEGGCDGFTVSMLVRWVRGRSWLWALSRYRGVLKKRNYL